MFFGTEDEPEAYFIQLEDCGHIIEYTAMDQYMGMDDNQQANEGEQVAIKLKECPKCRTPIRKNLRYGSHINRSLAEIEMVKLKINGPQKDIEEHRKALQKQWADHLRNGSPRGIHEHQRQTVKILSHSKGSVGAGKQDGFPSKSCKAEEDTKEKYVIQAKLQIGEVC